VRHIVSELNAAVGEGRRDVELAASYRLGGGDLARVRRHEGVPTDEAARFFLVERALIALGDQVERCSNGCWQLAVPADALCYDGHPLVLHRDDSARLHDSFNP
jgi:hypothetical protein